MKRRPQSGIFLRSHNVILLNSIDYYPDTVRGLVLFHELVHAQQKRTGIPAPSHPNARALRELQAYELEFKVLDRLNLPGYKEALEAEVRRVRSEFQQQTTSRPNLANPYLDVMFPDVGMQVQSRTKVASILLFRAILLMVERDFKPEEVAQKKLWVTQKITGRN